jgi:hypothetical protein
MQMITTIGLDIAKSVFKVHGVDAGNPEPSTQDPTTTLRVRRSSSVNAAGRPYAAPVKA